MTNIFSVKRRCAWLRCTVIASVCMLPLVAAADHEVYSDDSSKVVFKGTVMGAFFPNSNSWFGESESFLGEDTDSWGEFGAEIGFAGEYTFDDNSTFFGEFSALYTATGGDDASGVTIGEDDTDQASIEQAHIGWRYTDPFSVLEEDTFTLSVGRQDYLIGTGLLIADGGSDGGENGGWYLGMRKAFQESAIASLKSSTLVAEGFFLKNRPRRGGTQGKAWGGNLEYTFPGELKVGGTYMVVDPELLDTDELDVFSGRLGWSGLGGLELNGEYVIEDSSQIDADGYTARSHGRLPIAPGPRGSVIAMRTSTATIRTPQPMSVSAKSLTATPTTAPGSRAKSPATIRSPTATSKATSSASRPHPSSP